MLVVAARSNPARKKGAKEAKTAPVILRLNEAECRYEIMDGGRRRPDLPTFSHAQVVGLGAKMSATGVYKGRLPLDLITVQPGR